MGKKKEEILTVEVMADSLESMADNVAELSKVGKAIKESRLNQRAILLILSSMTGLYQQQIKSVLDSLADMEETFLKKKK